MPQNVKSRLVPKIVFLKKIVALKFGKRLFILDYQETSTNTLLRGTRRGFLLIMWKWPTNRTNIVRETSQI